jgi:chemotaxis protein methyltransferase CheR
MRVADFELYKDLLYEKSGLVITPDKSYLLDSRLSPVAKKWDFMSIELMTLQLRALPDSDLVRDVVEAMTTNETSFFRDIKPFTEFENTILPALMKANANTKSIRIWCAAASSGQEPYSLAMILKEKEALLKGWKIEIIATDISEDILEIAKRGIYSQFEVQRGLPVTHLLKYFEQINEKWRIKDDLRNMIKFGYFNLLSDMSRLGTFDLIFCRNVLIYFDEKTKAKTLDKMAGRLDKNGFLFLGGAETVLGLTNKFVIMPEKRGLYVLPGSHGTPEAAPAAGFPVKTG